PPSQQIIRAPENPDPSQPSLPGLGTDPVLRRLGLQMDEGPLGAGAALPKSATELAPGLKIGEALEQPAGKEGLIAQRLRTARGRTEAEGGAIEDPYKGEPLIVGVDAMRRDPEQFALGVSLLRHNAAETGGVITNEVIDKKTGLPKSVSRLAYPLPRGLLAGDTERDAQSFMQHVANNLLFIFDNMPAEIRERAKLWYVGANKIAAERAKHYGLPDTSVAGVYAALSPQKDWFMNVSLGDRLLYTAMNHGAQPFTAEMAATAARIYGKPKYAAAMERVSRSTLNDLELAGDKAMWLRIFDETYNIDKQYGLRTHPVVTPEGEFAGLRMNK